MSRVVNHRSRRIVSLHCGILAAICVESLTMGQAQAVPPTPVAFTMTMSPYARTLNAWEEFGPSSPEFMEVWKEDSWDNPHLRVRARNKPAIMIVNEDVSVAPLTTFTLEINDPGPFFFGTGDGFPMETFVGFIQDTIYTDPGVTITGSSVSGDGKTLMVNFDGLTAGRKAIFNIDLDTTDPGLFPFPDYRMVLCGAPSSPSDMGVPATISGTFTNVASPPPNTTTLTMDLEATTVVPEFFEQFVRPAKEMEMNEIKEKFIPEPSSAVLALAGIAGLMGLRRRRQPLES